MDTAPTDTGRTAPAAATDEERIRALVARSQQAQSDAAALPALHTTDAVIVNVAGRRLLGRAAFESAMAGALTSPLKDVRTELEVDEIRFPASDAAVVSLTKTIHDERPDAPDTPEFPSSTVLTYVVVREGGRWRIALAQTTPVE